MHACAQRVRQVDRICAETKGRVGSASKHGEQELGRVLWWSNMHAVQEIADAVAVDGSRWSELVAVVTTAANKAARSRAVLPPRASQGPEPELTPDCRDLSTSPDARATDEAPTCAVHGAVQYILCSSSFVYGRLIAELPAVCAFGVLHAPSYEAVGDLVRVLSTEAAVAAASARKDRSRALLLLKCLSRALGNLVKRFISKSLSSGANTSDVLNSMTPALDAMVALASCVLADTGSHVLDTSSSSPRGGAPRRVISLVARWMGSVFALYHTARDARHSVRSEVSTEQVDGEALLATQRYNELVGEVAQTVVVRSEKSEKDGHWFSSLAYLILLRQIDGLGSTWTARVLQLVLTLTLRHGAARSRLVVSALLSGGCGKDLVATTETRGTARTNHLVEQLRQLMGSPSGQQLVTPQIERFVLRDKLACVSALPLLLTEPSELIVQYEPGLFMPLLPVVSAVLTQPLPKATDSDVQVLMHSVTEIIRALVACLRFSMKAIVTGSRGEEDPNEAGVVDDGVIHELVVALLDACCGKRKSLNPEQRLCAVRCLVLIAAAAEAKAQAGFQRPSGAQASEMRCRETQLLVLNAIAEWLASPRNEASDSVRAEGYHCMVQWALVHICSVDGKSLEEKLPIVAHDFLVSKLTCIESEGGNSSEGYLALDAIVLGLSKGSEASAVMQCVCSENGVQDALLRMCAMPRTSSWRQLQCGAAILSGLRKNDPDLKETALKCAGKSENSHTYSMQLLALLSWSSLCDRFTQLDESTECKDFFREGQGDVRRTGPGVLKRLVFVSHEILHWLDLLIVLSRKEETRIASDLAGAVDANLDAAQPRAEDRNLFAEANGELQEQKQRTHDSCENSSRALEGFIVEVPSLMGVDQERKVDSVCDFIVSLACLEFPASAPHSYCARDAVVETMRRLRSDAMPKRVLLSLLRVARGNAKYATMLDEATACRTAARVGVAARCEALRVRICNAGVCLDSCAPLMLFLLCVPDFGLSSRYSGTTLRSLRVRTFLKGSKFALSHIDAAQDGTVAESISIQVNPARSSTLVSFESLLRSSQYGPRLVAACLERAALDFGRDLDSGSTFSVLFASHQTADVVGAQRVLALLLDLRRGDVIRQVIAWVRRVLAHWVVRLSALPEEVYHVSALDQENSSAGENDASAAAGGTANHARSKSMVRKKASGTEMGSVTAREKQQHQAEIDKRKAAEAARAEKELKMALLRKLRLELDEIMAEMHVTAAVLAELNAHAPAEIYEWLPVLVPGLVSSCTAFRCGRENDNSEGAQSLRFLLGQLALSCCTIEGSHRRAFASDSSAAFASVAVLCYYLYRPPTRQELEHDHGASWARGNAARLQYVLPEFCELVQRPLGCETFTFLLPLLGFAITGSRAGLVLASRNAHHDTETQAGQEINGLRVQVAPLVTQKVLEFFTMQVKGDGNVGGGSSSAAAECAAAAAGAHAGTWLLAILEREDSLFNLASDALYELASRGLSGASSESELAQLLDGFLSDKESVREACIEALGSLDVFAAPNGAYESNEVLTRFLWFECHDVDRTVAERAEALWEIYAQPLQLERVLEWLLGLLTSDKLAVRRCAADALAEALKIEASNSLGTDRDGAEEGSGRTNARSGPKQQLVTSTLSKICSIYMDGIALTQKEQQNAQGKGSRTRQPVKQAPKLAPLSTGGMTPALATSSSSKEPNVTSERDEQNDAGWTHRHGATLALHALAARGALHVSTDLPVLFAFLSARALGDLHPSVRSAAVACATVAIESAGSLGPQLLLGMVEAQLQKEPAPSEGSGVQDSADVAHADASRENLIVCVGMLAAHLPADDPRVERAVLRVVQTAVDTPSESVQRAAMRCLRGLAPALRANEALRARELDLRGELVGRLLDADKQASFGARRGAAYALAGLLRGGGLAALKRAGLHSTIVDAVSHKTAKVRQGAFFLAETLAAAYGVLYEPYTVRLVGALLQGMGDSALEVRLAAEQAAQVMMAELTSEGVRLVLGDLLGGLRQMQWRTKAAAAELLGAMAFCAPRQLALCLPQIVPELARSMADAHPKVAAAAERAIARIAAVARSPELRALSGVLISALREPETATRGALDAMLATEFIHAVDAASLALLVPPLQRALRGRDTQNKIRAATIVGAISAHVHAGSDVMPYLPQLLPPLHAALFDPLPLVRRTAARACGSLAASLRSIVPASSDALKKSEKDTLGTLFSIRELDRALAADLIDPAKSSAERSGAAMAIAEMCSSMSELEFEHVFTTQVLMQSQRTHTDARIHANETDSVLPGRASTTNPPPQQQMKRFAITEGSLLLIAAMPASASRGEFEPRVPDALPLILRGLSSESEAVRAAALLAGKAVVRTYARSSLRNILPVVLLGMQHTSWRIRFSSTQLLADFVISITGGAMNKSSSHGAGSPGEMDADAEDNHAPDNEADASENGDYAAGEAEDGPSSVSAPFSGLNLSAAAVSDALVQVLGRDQLNEILALLYIARCDVSGAVRQSAVALWKIMVHNTPRTLRAVLPLAISRVLQSLGDEDEERRATAGRTLGDLAQKLGERVMPDVLPVLQRALKSGDEQMRRGACEGLDELVLATERETLALFLSQITAIICDALIDHVALVREAGTAVFVSTYKTMGARPLVEDVLSFLISKLFSKAKRDAHALSGDGVVPGPVDNDDQRDDGELLPQSDRALDSMQRLLQASGPRLLAFVFPRLINEDELPLSVGALRALSAAVRAGGHNTLQYVDAILYALFTSIIAASSSLSSSNDDVQNTEVSAVDMQQSSDLVEPDAVFMDSVQELMLSCTQDEELQDTVFNKVVNNLKSSSPAQRVATARAVTCLCAGAPAVATQYAPQIAQVFVRQLADVDDGVARECWACVDVLVRVVGGKDASVHATVFRQALRLAHADAQVQSNDGAVNGLRVRNAATPFVSVYIEALLHGSPELREQGALALAELIEMSTATQVQPFVIKITGALIRVASDRVPWQLKAAILFTLLRALHACPVMLKTFVPQLQSTFLKALLDDARLVRMRAVQCIGALALVSSGTPAATQKLELLLAELTAMGSTRAADLRSADTEPAPPETREAAWLAFAELVSRLPTGPGCVLSSAALRLASDRALDAAATDGALSVHACVATGLVALLGRPEMSVGDRGTVEEVVASVVAISQRDTACAHGQAALIAELLLTSSTVQVKAKKTGSRSLTSSNVLSSAAVVQLSNCTQALASHTAAAVRIVGYRAACHAYFATAQLSYIEPVLRGAETDPAVDGRISAIRFCGVACQPSASAREEIVHRVLPVLSNAFKVRNSGVTAAVERALRKALVDELGNDKLEMIDTLYELLGDDAAQQVVDCLGPAVRMTPLDSEAEDE
ncbi:Protein ILITYHIA [Porphyridium purpureum]|uniref:Protein ILITYHIA n=1 Tax=Porphyridium purpureum TaxID=35688 RepID=A0A5J4Z7W3_PORPP|nr:Protein ILITYHIA [Porphyridium purpureum]|eukprot:POR2010..scf295_1